jgi:hypothetical protein
MKSITIKGNIFGNPRYGKDQKKTDEKKVKIGTGG